MKNDYFLGLDIGTNSVGHAVTNKAYEVLKFKDKAMWGAHIFEEGSLAAQRRTFRSARRRLARKKQRVQLARELLAKEIVKVDYNFFQRLDESALNRNDKNLDTQYSLFDDANMTDKDYHKKFPTIHHLIVYLINTNKKEDIRLIYLAISHILSQRGHFLIEVDKDDIKNVTSFDVVYDSFRNYFIENEIESNWSEDIKFKLGNILKRQIGLREKQKQIKQLVFVNSVQKNDQALIKAICGAKFKLSDMFEKESYKDLENNSLSLSDKDFDDKLLSISEHIDDNDFDLIKKCKAIYDWSVLTDIMMDKEYISEGKIAIYEQHKNDLRLLKDLVKKYLPQKYNEVFRFSKAKLDNYVAYSGNFKSASNYEKGIDKNKVNKVKDLAFTKTDNESFCKYIKQLLKDVEVDSNDKDAFEDLKRRLDLKNSFMPKQVSLDNGVIPYQLTRHQLKALLENSAKYHPFLLEKDKDNLNIIEKLLSILEFKIPYYVGPLNNFHGKFSWIAKKAEGKILPWNFNQKVDLDKSEEKFIRRMTGKCTYLAGEDVLCKNSLLYSKFMVLNEINNITLNDKAITVECKQKIYKEIFEKRKGNITRKRIKYWLISNNYMNEDEELRGVDATLTSSLRPYHDFKRIIHAGVLSEEQVENIIVRLSITTDYNRIKLYLKDNFPNLTNEDIKYISSLRYKDYGRLSKKLLTEIQSVNSKTGEYTNIIGALWDTNYNLIQLLSQSFDYKNQIDKLNEQYYSENPMSINSMLEDMYISNAVKRPIFRTLDIVKEIKGIMKKDPKKIFIEMARWKGEKKPTKSRKERLIELYKNLDKEYKEKWEKLLNKVPNDKLKSERFYLYYIQLGKCMYTGENINLDQLMDDMYDIDHIYPQSKVDDDSIHNNKVLVKQSANRIKSDKYPLKPEWQKRMSSFWNMLASKGLITKEKLFRLTRTTGFSQEELSGFINRQLVETQQSTKAIARILKNIFPNSEIVYVKSGLISKFRHQFNLPKSRILNDLHHAKDAYLTIVMGNVYNVKFTKNPLNFIRSKEKYSINIKEKNGLLSNDIERNGEIAWKSDGSTIKTVKKTMNKNNINYVRYAFTRKGGFFNQNPDKATTKDNELIPRKKGLSPEYYGGYNNTTASFFTLVKHIDKGKDCISIKPVELLVADKFMTDNDFALDYCKNKLKLNKPEFFENRKILKVNTVLSIDGFRAVIASKTNKGATLVLSSNTPLILSPSLEAYVKRIESKLFKVSKNNEELKIREKYDKITRQENEILYNELNAKLEQNIFKKLPMYSKVSKTIQEGKQKFNSLSLEDQVETLANIIKVFKTGRTTGCDLRKIGGSKASAVITLNAKISTAKFKNIQIIDQSATGLFEKRSVNLLEL